MDGPLTGGGPSPLSPSLSYLDTGPVDDPKPLSNLLPRPTVIPVSCTRVMMRGSREDAVEWRSSAAFWSIWTLDATMSIAGKFGQGVASNRAQRAVRQDVRRSADTIVNLDHNKRVGPKAR